MDKYAPEDVPNINSTCFKLNSLQLQALLQNYHCAPDEPFIPTVRAAPVPRGTRVHRAWGWKQRKTH